MRSLQSTKTVGSLPCKANELAEANSGISTLHLVHATGGSKDILEQGHYGSGHVPDYVSASAYFGLRRKYMRGLWRGLKEVLVATAKAIDAAFANILCVAGLIGIGGGLWIWKPWVSLTVTGLVMLLLGLRGSIAQAHRTKK